MRIKYEYLSYTLPYSSYIAHKEAVERIEEMIKIECANNNLVPIEGEWRREDFTPMQIMVYTVKAVSLSLVQRAVKEMERSSVFFSQVMSNKIEEKVNADTD